MKLYEILDTKIDIEYESNSNTFKAKATIDNNVYICVCDFAPLSEIDSNFIEFSHQKHLPDELKNLEQHIKHVWEISFYVLDHYGYHQHDLTNSNIPLKVFSFVKQSLIKFSKKFNQNYILFTSDLKSRKNVYSKLISKSIKIKNKYEFNNGHIDMIIMEI